MSLDDLILAWQAGDTDDVIATLGESDATRWEYRESILTDPIDEIERAALAFLGND